MRLKGVSITQVYNKMASDNGATMWALRIHQVDGVTDDRIAKFCANVDGAYLMAKETDAARVHYQGWVITTMKEVTLRARVKKAFPECVGNNGYSLKAVKETPENYQRYCCKGTEGAAPVVVAKHGVQYSDEWVTLQWESFWQHEKAGAYALKKAKGSANERIWEAVDELSKTEELTPTRVATVIVDMYAEVGKPYDVFGVRRLTYAIMSKYSKKFRRAMVKAVVADELCSAFDTPKEYGGINEEEI